MSVFLPANSKSDVHFRQSASETADKQNKNCLFSLMYQLLPPATKRVEWIHFFGPN